MICNDKPSIQDTLLLLYLGLIQFPSHSEDTSCLTKQSIMFYVELVLLKKWYYLLVSTNDP